jgi:hypothetical protein
MKEDRQNSHETLSAIILPKGCSISSPAAKNPKKKNAAMKVPGIP